MTTTPLDKTFDPAAIEAKWYAHWESNGLFRPERPNAQPFTIVNPPPNVTGSLHVGHALDNTLQDIVVRYERLRGKDALWVVGTDHAGIATQMVVERQLEANQDKRTNYTREAFVDKVWEWKAESGGTITGQLRRLGCSMDWSREQFTMDPHFTKAVTKVFVDLYNQGLIYRDKRLVNWDPKLKTAISDLEVETREIQGHFWHFRYPLADGVKLANGADHIVVATTRPETMLADMAVAVNAKDERYQSVIGKFILQPITGRRIPIVADDHADPELGSGAVKITPGHDFNDFEVGKRAGFKPAEMLNMFDAEANVVQVADGLIPERFVGMHRFKDGRDSPDGAREAVVAELKAAGSLVLHPVTGKDGEVSEKDAEDRTIQTPCGDRSSAVIEPWLTDQWYVDAATLAVAPMEAVRSGAIEIVPKSWEKTYFNWMENIQPWCVSRQLWWGHRIPAWYGPTSKNNSLRYDLPFPYVAASPEDRMALAASNPAYNGQTVTLATSQIDAINLATMATNSGTVYLWPDEDVLDTWFSSALWPFATLGWPEENPPRNGEVARSDGGVEASPETLRSKDGTRPLPPSGVPPRSGEDLLARHYPNDLLISGFDILFFWCARMAMMGMKFNADETGKAQVPWKRLYLHGLVRAADGQKMSKSKGNVVDPLGLIDQYGADALRFFMAAMESQGRDVKMDEKRVEGYRNFATKLWNAARFLQARGVAASKQLNAPKARLPINKWIIGEVVGTLAELDKSMADLRFDAAANALYHFVWNTFCDWYLELIKPIITATNLGTTADEETRSSAEETSLVAGWVLDQILVMLHPFMPFVTEELWSTLGNRMAYPLITALWPSPDAEVDAEAKAEVEWLITLVSEVRAARAELNVPPSARTNIHIDSADLKLFERMRNFAPSINHLARIDKFAMQNGILGVGIGPAGDAAIYEELQSGEAAVQIVVEGVTYVIPLEGVIDLTAERTRLTKTLEASTKEAKSLEGRLSNPAFVEKAKPEAVEKARADHAAHTAEAERLSAALARLG